MITVWLAFYLAHLLGWTTEHHQWWYVPFVLTSLAAICGEIFVYWWIVMTGRGSRRL